VAGKRRFTIVEGLVVLGILLVLALPFIERAETGKQSSAEGVAASAPAEPGDGLGDAEEAQDRPKRGPTVADRIRVAMFVILAVVVTGHFVREILKRRR
jgi:hypothetical protein